MSFSNLPKSRIEANSNLRDYKRVEGLYKELGKKEKMYSNLQHAQGLISSMIEDSDIIQNDFNHQIVNKSMDTMTTVFNISNPNSQEIDMFYTSYEGITNINKILRGENND